MDSAPFGLGFGELVFIALLALVLLGPKRLPEVGRAAGKLFVQLRRSGMELRRSFEEEVARAEDDGGDIGRLKLELAQAGKDVSSASRDLLNGIARQPAAPRTVPAASVLQPPVAPQAVTAVPPADPAVSSEGAPAPAPPESPRGD